MSDLDIPTLSNESLIALTEFYAEQEKKDLELRSLLESDNVTKKISFEEDWQLSQFWYDELTVEILTNEISRIAVDNRKIALISCPTLYGDVKRKCKDCEVILFEYDKRFSVHGKDYYFYDYKEPLNLPRTFSNYFDIVVADPPFLSEECLTKTAVSIKFLGKEKIILCTGAVMENLVWRLLKLKKCNFKPKHKNNLANEFLCYTNYEFNIPD